MALTVKFQPFVFLNFLNQFWYFFGIPAFFLSPIISWISSEYFFDIYIYLYIYIYIFVFSLFFCGNSKMGNNNDFLKTIKGPIIAG